MRKKTLITKTDIFLILAVIINFLISLGIWRILNNNLEYKAFNQFVADVDKESEEFQRKLEIYTDALYSIRGLFAVKNEITKSEWEIFNDSFKFAERYPGITGVGYIRKVNAADLATYETKLSKEYKNLSEYSNGIKVFPETGNQSPDHDHLVLSYITPLSPSVKNIGYDLSVDSKRLDALIMARDSGIPTSTEKVQLINDSNEPGIVIYLAVYKPGTPVDTIERRRENIEGYISVAFKIPDLIDEVFKEFSEEETLGVDIYDVTMSRTLSDANLIYVTDPEISASAKFQNKSRVNLGGRFWEVIYKAGPAYGTDPEEKNVINIVFLLMVLTSLFLIGVSYRQVNNKRKRDELRQNVIPVPNPPEVITPALIDNM